MANLKWLRIIVMTCVGLYVSMNYITWNIYPATLPKFQSLHGLPAKSLKRIFNMSDVKKYEPNVTENTTMWINKYMPKNTYHEKFQLTNDTIENVVKAWRMEYEKTQTFFDVYKTKQPEYLGNFRNPCFIEEGNLSCLPYFMVIGITKCGTSDLYQKITYHPHVKAVGKEKQWWNRGIFKGQNLDIYIKQFSKAVSTIQSVTQNINGSTYHPVVTGEATPATIWDNHNWMTYPNNYNSTEPMMHVPMRIKHLLPNARFILIVRNPTHRFISGYNYFKAKTISSSSSSEIFHAHVMYAIQWMTDCFKALSRAHCLFDPPAPTLSLIGNDYYLPGRWNIFFRIRLGLYSEYLAEWNKVFRSEQTLVVRLEDYQEDRFTVLNMVYRHMGLDDLDDTQRNEVNQMNVKNRNGKPRKPVLSITIQALNDFYAPFNAKLAAMLQNKRFLFKQ